MRYFESSALSTNRSRRFRPSTSYLFEKESSNTDRLQTLLQFVGNVQKAESPGNHRHAVNGRHQVGRASKIIAVAPAQTIKSQCSVDTRTRNEVVLSLRMAEWRAWTEGDVLQRYKRSLRVLAWWSVVIYTLFPLIFCIGYGIKFSNRLALMWLQQAVVDVIISYAFTQLLSVSLSVFAGWLYVKLYPKMEPLLQRLQLVCKRRTKKVQPAPLSSPLSRIGASSGVIQTLPKSRFLLAKISLRPKKYFGNT